MKKRISEFLRKIADLLYKEPLSPEPKRIGLLPTSIVRRAHQGKKKLCPMSNKISLSEHNAKERAQNSTIPKLRAYKCLFCPDWHVTKQKAKLTLH